MVDARPDIAAMVPGAYVSAVVGRQLYQASAAIPTMRADGHLANCVIIELGTNGPFTRAQLVDLLRSLGRPKRIVLVNTRVPRPWQAVVNQTLADVAATWPHTVLVNWYALSQGKAAWFWPDGVHLDPVGAKVYARLLVDAVEAPRA
jgi:lysophospholipase L1-like esterase